MPHEHSHNDHDSRHGEGHGHTHGVIDASITTSAKGLWAIKWSFIGLLTTAVLQILVVALSGSVALLADTIHNFGDAATAIPLGIAFMFCRLKPTRTFSYGYGRVEDLAGLAVVAIILFSAIVAGYEAISRLIHPQAVTHLGAVAAASIIGFLGNEIVAIFRISVGKEIHSAALIADGYHARTDGYTSLAVLFGAVGVWLGFPLADPLIGLGITIAIFFIVWDSVKAVLLRALDGVEPEIKDEIEHAASHVKGVEHIKSLHARWMGHALHAELTVVLESHLSVHDAHHIAEDIGHEVRHHVPFLASIIIQSVPHEHD